MARRLYTLLVLLAVPLASLVVLWRGVREREYWRGWGERFGSGPPLAGNGRTLWLHAVSVGEVQAAASLVAAMQREWPDLRLAATSATPAGRARATAAFGAGVEARYAPYDLPWSVRAALRRLRPELLVVMETELWPNLLNECARAGVRVLIVSARLSERSRARWSRFRALLQPALGRGVRVAAQSAADAQRFIALGVPAAHVQVCGNIKFDREPRASVRSGGAAWRARYAPARPLWVAGSTHAGEELAALQAHATVRAACPEALLVLAPRHRPRFDEVARLLDGRGLRWLRHSAVLADPAGTAAAAAQAEVLLLDTIGDLEDFYAAADVAFVGGSLVPVGGHNLLEPAALGVPTLAGPAQGNAPDIARLLQQNGGLRLVHDAAGLGAAVQELLADPDARARMAEAGLATVASNRGALDQALAMIRDCLAKPAPG
ncbi:MAG TPA: lipid IV(A) 3-deoxy-D-manno-octulosonic acid transferase [Steroidobacteraceae bacterium]|nr:lipid IV(A) 3-deoxy-D-manno-octulosonic acid transferase [Steroidobacteraceae bacterium]